MLLLIKETQEGPLRCADEEIFFEKPDRGKDTPPILLDTLFAAGDRRMPFNAKP